MKVRATRTRTVQSYAERETDDSEESELDSAIAGKETKATPVKKKPAIPVHTLRKWAFLHYCKDVFLSLLPESSHSSFLGKKAFITSQAESVAKFTVESPKSILATLKDYQIEGLSFLVWLASNGMNGILGDEMGLGKTLQTISFLAYLKETEVAGKVGGPFLVVCPLSVMSSWETEIRKWCPDLTFVRFHGPRQERESIKIICNKQKFDIYLTTYEQIVAEAGWFKSRKKWRCLILDEGHRIKNEKANISSKIHAIPSDFRYILTGTPLQNNLHELWALLHFLLPEVFAPITVNYFIESFNLTKGTYNQTAIDSARSLLDLIMIRRTKAQVLTLVSVYLPLTPMQRFWYKRMLTKLDKGLIEEIFGAAESRQVNKENSLLVEGTKELAEHAVQNGKGQWSKLMNILLQLRKVCNHPYMLPDSEPEPFENGDHVILASSKFIFLDKLLASLIRDGHKVLIFSQFTRMLDIFEDFLNWKSIRFARLDGSTNRPRRKFTIRQFQRPDSPFDVFLISTKAGGFGLNLTSADTIIMFDSDWNPQNDIQAMARCHRIGQTKPVTVYRLISQDTAEEQMMTRLQKKLLLSLQVTSSGSANEGVPALAHDDLMAIFRYGSRALTVDESENDAEELLSRSLDDILEASIKREQAADAAFENRSDGMPQFGNGAFASELFSGAEKVKSRLFEGMIYEKGRKSAKDLIKFEGVPLGKRVRNERTIKVGANTVLKELQECRQWEAAPLLSSKHQESDTNHHEPKKRVKRVFDHEQFCIVCKEGDSLYNCSGCPRTIHAKCAGMSTSKMERLMSYYCPQHTCCICDRKTQDAGGLLFRCGTCPNAYCDDCLPEEDEELLEIGETLPDFEEMNYFAVNMAYFIKCPSCVGVSP